MDFHQHYRLDILDFFRGRMPWGKLLRLKDALPIASHYRNKVLKDPAIAESVLELERQQEEYTIPGEGEVELSFVDETPTYTALREVQDSLSVLIYLTAANSKAAPPQPSPRPETAVAKLRGEQVDKTLDDALSQMLGSAW